MAEILWHNLPIEKVIKILQSDIEKGLTENEVKKRQARFGLNKLPEEKPFSRLTIFLGQFRSPLIYILITAGIITLILQDFSDAIIIFGAVFLNTIVGFLQENKASQTLRNLKKVVKHEAEVLRGGNLKIVDSIELVPGDIVILNPGDKVPADGRIVESFNLKINEMALTGEWISAKKKPEILPKDTPLADRDNMVYMGTIVEDGRGKVIVTETGVNTEIGKVAIIIREAKEEKTPYQKKLANFSKTVGIIISFLCFLIFIVGMASKREFVEMFTTAVAVAVAAIPEGLPVAMTVILALGMQRILGKKGLVRKLVSTETLGSTSVICSDKTATLTEGKMKMDEIIGDKFLTLKAAVLTSQAFIENPDEPKEKWIVRGEPTEKALLEAGMEAGINGKREFEKKKIAEIPFNPINKFSAALYQENEGNFLYICGAPEKILEISKLNEDEKLFWEKKLNDLAQKGLRVVASAYKKVSDNISLSIDLIKDLNFLGFITLKDPIRQEAKEAIKICQEAGMRPIIVTGDHKLTAKAVAEELDFKIKEENILEGKDLDKLSDKEFEKTLEKIKIYARVEPRHKMKIVGAWQERGEIVAMTGDGINDAPALKQADIGVALGSGTEVAKETADLILLNDSFSIIVAAVEEGRAILDNIRKVITYLFCSAFTEVILIGGSMIIFWLIKDDWILPILAAQILWINLIEDGPLSLALAFEPKEKDLMKQKPASHKMPLLTGEMKILIFVIGIITDLLLLALFFWLFKFSGYKISHIRSVIFAALAIDSIFYIFSCKSLRKNIWQINLLSNRFLILAWLFAILVLLAGLYLSPLQILLRTEPLNFFDWQLVFGVGFLNLFLIEITKWFFITKKKNV